MTRLGINLKPPDPKAVALSVELVGRVLGVLMHGGCAEPLVEGCHRFEPNRSQFVVRIGVSRSHL